MSLIVEDEPELARLYGQWLSDEYEVTTANDGDEALEQITEEVDVVLLDRRMPTLSGDEVLDRIRERNLECRVAMVTAVEPDFDIVKMGFDDYLVKPISKEQLIDIIEQLQLRTTYDDQLQEFFSLASKKAILDEKKTDGEIKASREYATLEDRIAVLRSEVEDTVSELLKANDHRNLCQDIRSTAIMGE
ncbi:MAG: response regulator [Natrialbaceae archaeon]|nr:response regulator [Natrialbaceae archaeon]